MAASHLRVGGHADRVRGGTGWGQEGNQGLGRSHSSPGMYPLPWRDRGGHVCAPTLVPVDLHVALGGVHAVVQGLDGHPANRQAALGKRRVTIREV